ncbi:MAG: TetR/AcrR family transcriptional regulator [Burkholderiaceae bacterium]|nr:TetR/AcrR family transcriptional regulator [Burkholderiaceae bacterium]
MKAKSAADGAAAGDDLTSDWRFYGKDSGLGPVLDAALRVFTNTGYHGTSVRTIAQEAKLSVPGLYYHFASKQEMLVALLKHSSGDLLRRARGAVADGASPKQRLCLLVENIVLYMAHRRQLAHLAREMQFLEAPHRKAHVARRDELESMVRREIENGVASGEFRTQDVPEATRAVWVLCRSVADWYAPKGPKSPAELARAYVGFALALVGGD